MTKAYGIKWYGTEVGYMVWYTIPHTISDAQT